MAKHPNNPERFSTMKAGKRLHRSEEKRMGQRKSKSKKFKAPKETPKETFIQKAKRLLKGLQ